MYNPEEEEGSEECVEEPMTEACTHCGVEVDIDEILEGLCEDCYDEQEFEEEEEEEEEDS